MKTEYFYDNHNEFIIKQQKGSRKSLCFNKNDAAVFEKIISQFNIYELFISELINADSKKVVVKLKSQILKNNESFFSVYRIDSLNQLFCVGLTKVTVNVDSNLSRLVGLKNKSFVNQETLNEIAFITLNLGINNRYKILNIPILSKFPFELMVLKSYLSSDNFHMYEIVPESIIID